MGYIVAAERVQPDTSPWEGEGFQLDGLTSLIDQTASALLGWGNEDNLDRGAVRKLLPERRDGNQEVRRTFGWTYAEIAEIVRLLREQVERMRQDAAALQANPSEVVNPSDPWGEKMVVVGDVDLLRQAAEVEELVSKWLGSWAEGGE
tara:strand:+ start:757 stop:1200 length:444 start_codon:yes stop_codon:yes gene_type:complete